MATNNFSAQSVVLDLLRYIGVTGFTAPANDQALNQPGLDADDVRRAIGAVNSGLQSIQKWGPQAMKDGPRSATFLAPDTLTLNIAAGAKTAVAATVPSAAMKGCSILIEGDADLNRIMGIATNTVTFLRGYMGANNPAAAAAVYFDCASLDADTDAVLEPVSITGNIRIYPARDLDDFERFRQRWWSNYSGYGGTVSSTLSKNPGTPSRYIVERQRDGTPFLRLTPMPGQMMTATFKAKLRAERITAAVLDLTGATDPAYYFTSLNDDEVESLLLPIARWRFFVHPALKNAESAQRVKVEYDEAMSMLKNGLVLEPSVPDNTVTYI